MTDFTEIWRHDGPPVLSMQEARVTRNGHSWTQRRLIAADGRQGVVIIPIRGTTVGLVRIWRPAVGAQQLELPRGFGEGDVAELDARRELLEETGLEASSIEEIGDFILDSGLVPTPIVAFEAVVGAGDPGTTTDGEIDEMVWVERDSLSDLIGSGQLRDGISLAALACWQARSA